MCSVWLCYSLLQSRVVPRLLPLLQVLAQISSLFCSPVTSVTVLSYQTQLVAGTNYRVLALLNGDQLAVINAFQPLPIAGQAQPLQVKSVTAWPFPPTQSGLAGGWSEVSLPTAEVQALFNKPDVSDTCCIPAYKVISCL